MQSDRLQSFMMMCGVYDEPQDSALSRFKIKEKNRAKASVFRPSLIYYAGWKNSHGREG